MTIDLVSVDVAGNEGNGSSFITFDAVQAAVVQVGAEIVTTVDAANHIALKSVSLVTLHAGDFRFVA